MKRINAYFDVRQAPALMDTNEASLLLNCTPETVKRYCQQKKIPAIKICGQWRIPKDKLLKDIGF